MASLPPNPGASTAPTTAEVNAFHEAEKRYRQAPIVQNNNVYPAGFDPTGEPMEGKGKNENMFPSVPMPVNQDADSYVQARNE